MLDFKWFEISTDAFLLILSVLLLSLQLTLCFKVKNLFIRLIPTFLCFITAVVFFILVFVFDGWDSIGFLILSIWSGVLMLVCGLGWLIFVIIKKYKKVKRA